MIGLVDHHLIDILHKTSLHKVLHKYALMQDPQISCNERVDQGWSTESPEISGTSKSQVGETFSFNLLVDKLPKSALIK
jgi:hypothetical protein